MMPKPGKADYSWYTLEQKKPKEYDLVLLQDENGKIQKGWLGGGEWNFGYRRIGKVIMWRKYEGRDI